MRELGADAGIVFVTDSDPLGSRLDAAGIPHTSLGLARGREVVYHPRALASAVKALGPDGVILLGGGFLAAALRIGGYRGRVVAAMHSATLDLAQRTLRDRLMLRLDRTMGFWATDVDVAVSDFALEQIQRQPRRGRLMRIYNGVDLEKYTPTPSLGTSNDEVMTIGFAGRLIEGKGVDILLRAVAAGANQGAVRVRIAGDGPGRSMLERLAAELRLNAAAEFTGWSSDMPSFWRACDVAAMPSDRLVESFGMSAVEAMACARAVVVTANGALPELVDDNVTGFVVPPGDARVLANALLELARDVEKRRAVGRAARARCEQRFDIRTCAASYLDLFQDV